MDLENSGDVLVLTSVTRKDSGIYQCRPQGADAPAEVRGQMQLAVHCEEDTHTRTSPQPTRASLPGAAEAPDMSFLVLVVFQSWTRLWLYPKILNSC